METIIWLLMRSEGFLRVISMVLAITTALLVGLDRETKKVFFLVRTATVHDIQALWIAMIIASVTAGYQLLQLFLGIASTRLDRNPYTRCNKLFAWSRFVLDQGAAYAIFSGTVAASQGSMIALFGVKAMQWEKLCNIYTRFCVGIGSGLICGFLASLAMAVVSSISAYRLVRFCCSDPPPVNRVAEPSFL